MGPRRPQPPTLELKGAVVGGHESQHQAHPLAFLLLELSGLIRVGSALLADYHSGLSAISLTWAARLRPASPFSFGTVLLGELSCLVQVKSVPSNMAGCICVEGAANRRWLAALFVSPYTEGDGEKLFEAVCDLGLEGIVSKRLTSVYRSGRSKTWIKVKNPQAPAATRVIDGTF